MMLEQDRAIYELKRASVYDSMGPILATFDLTIRDRGITAVVGPMGSGKSTLLRLLSGRPAPGGWTVAGEWVYRGRKLDSNRFLRVPLRKVAWVPQIRHAPSGEFTSHREQMATRARIDGAFFCGAEIVLLDEPTRGLAREDREWLIARLREHVEEGAAVVISHDRHFVREVADEVCLLCDGELIAHHPASSFFDCPEEELVRQFVRWGTCSLPPIALDLPSHFHWFDANRLAGMGCPGLLRDFDDDLFSIAEAGVTMLVSLTEDAVPTERLRPFGIAGRHLPIRDMGVPSMSEAMALCHDLMRAIERGQVVAVHCRAGLGRTGTILGCLGVCEGMGADEAIARVRQRAPGSIQTEEQVAFVRLFAGEA